MNKSALGAGMVFLVLQVCPIAALEQPVVWRDEDTGCAYLLTPQGGISPRHRRDGTLDCPDVPANTGAVEGMGRDIARGLDALQREMERLRERYNNRP
ncbi:hypothetical protein JKG68_00955 [Microvirga aerilata]|uniref:Uncharacterized protein n=1 Tax=Microvirga aerilata TaxID=670292 RepID=A0A936Z5I2_9HYPH|nr:hypothetical protein [Microvirga aerilata]MBL0402531.1 hypothetical protein [Microvirga aerilata]